MLKLAVPIFTLAGLAAFFAGTAPTNPPLRAERSFQAVLQPPARVARMLDHSCGDCHSNRTVWPWYSRLPIVGARLRGDVEGGRAAFNLSDWGGTPDDAESSAATLLSMCGEMRTGKMPLPNYLMLHPDSRPASAEVATFCSWSSNRARELMHSPR